MSLLKHRGQLGSVDFDLDTKRLFGKLMFIDDLVTYEASDLEGLEREFRISVDEYLADCEELGVAPNKPFKGSFNVRVGSELHKKVAHRAAETGVGLNDYVIKALEDSLNGGSVVHHEHKHTHVIKGSAIVDYDSPQPSTGEWKISSGSDWSSRKREIGSCH
ncbi:toxin-antitoxin system HicB family antitoxin [Marinobacter maroccanus]|uniref:Toxin-antitoxin system HicB family antitoxin n=2 Tax=Marinobacter maroccanus TaxID=2055143 RepID=A0A2S5ZFT4_9GAMM|nr:toxin-antitoxin system HicB family antitoxin [Marinobacter maroccanus]